MDNHILFESMRRIYNTYAEPGAIDFSTIAMMVQTGGKNDTTYALGVACTFKALSGEYWGVFSHIYDTTKKITEKEMKVCRGPLQKFWRSQAMKQKRHEFERVAWRYVRQHESG